MPIDFNILLLVWIIACSKKEEKKRKVEAFLLLGPDLGIRWVDWFFFFCSFLSCTNTTKTRSDCRSCPDVWMGTEWRGIFVYIFLNKFLVHFIYFFFSFIYFSSFNSWIFFISGVAGIVRCYVTNRAIRGTNRLNMVICRSFAIQRTRPRQNICIRHLFIWLRLLTFAFFTPAPSFLLAVSLCFSRFVYIAVGRGGRRDNYKRPSMFLGVVEKRVCCCQILIISVAGFIYSFRSIICSFELVFQYWFWSLF